jgi:hypothetical protein
VLNIFTALHGVPLQKATVHFGFAVYGPDIRFFSPELFRWRQWNGEVEEKKNVDYQDVQKPVPFDDDTLASSSGSQTQSGLYSSDQRNSLVAIFGVQLIDFFFI